MTAHINANDVDSAEKVLSDLVPKVRAGEVQGTLTKCFNILLTALSLQREVERTMDVYHLMKSENIGANSLTYAAIMQGLVAYRQTDAAWKVLNETMPEEGHKPQAFHYAIVMTGFVRQNAYKTAMDIYAKMIRRDIKPTLNTDAIYAKARTLYGIRQSPWKDSKHDYPIDLIVEELGGILQDPNAGLAPRQPQLYSPMEDHSPRALMFSHLIYSYGSDRSLKAVKQLVERYKQAAKESGEDNSESLPLRILTAVMPAYVHAKRWSQVEACWKLAKTEADIMTISQPVLDHASEADVKTTTSILKLSVAKTTTESQMPNDVSKRAAKSKSDDPSRPVPALRHILSQPLRHHITSLALQRRFGEMITTVASVLKEGYVLDNSTWNIFIEHLLRSSPPLALLAFRLTERYLIPSFPGWVQRRYANHSAHAQGLPFIRARYLSPDRLMPRYRTLVKLGAALLAIRRRDALGDESSNLTSKDNEGLYKYVGSTRQIRKDAPRTLWAVQTMPTVEDRLQTVLLRREAMN
jgi:pentatricopeptide repeat-containing protein PET309